MSGERGKAVIIWNTLTLSLCKKRVRVDHILKDDDNLKPIQDYQLMDTGIHYRGRQIKVQSTSYNYCSLLLTAKPPGWSSHNPEYFTRALLYFITQLLPRRGLYKPTTTGGGYCFGMGLRFQTCTA